MARGNQRFRNRKQNNHHSSGRAYNRMNGPSNQGWDSYSSDEDNSDTINPNPFLRESRPDTRIRKNHCTSENSIIQPQTLINHHILLLKSQRIKKNLKRYLIQALAEIERWFPEGTLEAGDMDWQPENEVVIPQIDRSIVYSYGSPDKPRSNPPSNMAGVVGSFGKGSRGSDWTTPRVMNGFSLRAGSALLDLQSPPPTPLAGIK